MNIMEVKEERHKKAFVQLPVELYQHDEHWIRPLDEDIEKVFSSKDNKFFRHGECTRWVLEDSSGKTIGRVAAFINKKNEKSKNSLKQELHTGGMGFFEVIENNQAAVLLMDTAKKWLTDRGMNSMDGPINFGERDNWWGLLVDGFDRPPNHMMPYTKPYYQAYFEEYGFKVYFKQYTYGRLVNEPLRPEYLRQAERLFNDPRYTFSKLKMNELDKFAEDFRTVYNLAWVKHAGVKGMSSLQAKTLMRKMKQIVDPEVVYFAYYDEEPIAFFINLPDVNQILKNVNGKLNLIGKLKALYNTKMRTCKKMVGRAFGIVPEHQGKGVVAAIVEYSRRVVQGEIRRRYIDYEMNWIGDFNPKMMKVCEDIGSIVKTHHTYRMIFDEEIKFEYCKVID